MNKENSDIMKTTLTSDRTALEEYFTAWKLGPNP